MPHLSRMFRSAHDKDIHNLRQSTAALRHSSSKSGASLPAPPSDKFSKPVTTRVLHDSVHFVFAIVAALSSCHQQFLAKLHDSCSFFPAEQPSVAKGVSIQ